MKQYLPLLKKNLPQIVFAAFGLRLICLGASIGDAIALISLVAIYGFMHFMDKDKVEQFEDIQDQLKKMNDAISGTRLAQNLTPMRTTSNEPKKEKRYF